MFEAVSSQFGSTAVCGVFLSRCHPGPTNTNYDRTVGYSSCQVTHATDNVTLFAKRGLVLPDDGMVGVVISSCTRLVPNVAAVAFSAMSVTWCFGIGTETGEYEPWAPLAQQRWNLESLSRPYRMSCHRSHHEKCTTSTMFSVTNLNFAAHLVSVPSQCSVVMSTCCVLPSIIAVVRVTLPSVTPPAGLASALLKWRGETMKPA